MEEIEIIESPLELLPKKGSPERVTKKNGKLMIHPDIAVVRDSAGNAINRYKDDIWETTHYGTPGNMLFQKFGKNKDTIKRLCLVCLMEGDKSTRVFNMNVASSAYAVYTILSTMFQKLPNNTKVIEEAFQDREVMYTVADSLANSTAKRFKRVLEIIRILGKDVGVSLIWDEERNNLLDDKANQHQTKQHPPIPFPIYAEFFQQRWEHFEQIEENIEKLTSFIKRLATDTYFGREQVYKKVGRTDSSKLIPFVQAISLYELTPLFDHYDILNTKKGLGIITKFKSFISQINVTLAHLLSMLTGMRSGEMIKLVHGCYKAPDQKRPPLIVGFTSKKYRGIDKPQEWITHVDTKRVISVLEKLSSALLKGINLQFDDDIPLFVKSSFLDPQKRSISIHYKHNVISSLNPKNELPLNNDDGKLTLTQNMVDNFLKKTDMLPERWDNKDKVLIGDQWKPNFHQNRRTFAMLAINSGLVSFASLKGQLAQTSMLMAAYYGNGATNLDPIITNGAEHIAKEIEKLRIEQSTLALCHHLMNGKMDLGKEINDWERELIDNNVNDPVSFIKHLRETKKEVRKGNLSTKGTPIGWCDKIGRCDSFITFTFTGCGDCEHAKPDLERINESVEQIDSYILKKTKEGSSKDDVVIIEAERNKNYLYRQKEKLLQGQSNEL